MPAPATVNEFVDLVLKSGVAEDAKVKPHLDRLAAAGELPTEPSKLAGLMVRDGILSFFQAEQLLQGKWKRFFIGKYKVLEKIGTGGMGQVFLCEHKLMRRRVAVKVLPTAKAADPSSLERFYREARAVAALDHPNIVRAYDIDQDDNLHFLVMEFVDGTNFQDLVKKFGPLDITRACHYVYGSAVGLQYAFEMGIVHRDIKPGNILVDRSGVVKILDMGLARFFNDQDDQLTKKYDENVLGTADYLAPEQAVDSHTVDIRADIYSLGGTFYYLLTGSAPFPDGSVAQKLLWHQTREPRAVRQLRPEVPPELATILATMMAKEPGVRYATPNDLLAALSPWVQTPISPPPEAEMPQLSPVASGSPATGQTIRPSPSVLITPAPVAPSTGSGIPVVTVPAPVIVAPAASPPPADVWENLAVDTQPISKTEPLAPPPPSRRGQPAPVKAKSKLRALAVVGGLVVLAGAVFGVYKAVAPSVEVPAPGEGRKWYVGKPGSGGPAERTLPTLAEAARKAGTGDTILLTEDITDAYVLLEATSRCKGLTIESADATKPVKWEPAGSGTTLLLVRNLDSFVLRRVVVVLNGHYDTGLSVAGPQMRAELSDVSVSGAKGAGLVMDVSGTADHPVEVNRLRVSASKVGVHLRAKPPSASRQIRLDDLRIDGVAKAGVQIDGLASQVVVTHARIADAEVGVLLTGGHPAKAAPGGENVRVAGCTFYKTTDAVRVHQEKEADWVLGEVLVERCLFVSAGAVLGGKPVASVKLTGNARTNDTKDADTKTRELKADVGTDPADDATFLRYAARSPLEKVIDGQAVGVPPGR